MKIGKLFIGSRPTNDEGRNVIASWTHANGYWRWALYRSPWPAFKFKFGGVYGEEPRRFTPYGSGLRYFGAHLCLPYVGSFSLSTQPPALKEFKC